jgi:hypothetical protein
MSEIIDICTNPTEQSVLNRASTDKFQLVLNLPTVLRDKIFQGKSVNIDKLQISVYGAVVPEIQVLPIPVPFHGQTYNVTSYTRPNYPPLNVNFVVDNDFYNYWVLWRWLAILNTPRTSEYESKSKSLLDRDKIVEYQTNVSLYALNEFNTPTVEFRYLYCFPISLGGINYNYREQGSFIETTFQLQYSQLEVNMLTK